MRSKTRTYSLKETMLILYDSVVDIYKAYNSFSISEGLYAFYN